MPYLQTDVTKVTTRVLQTMKTQGEKIAMLTAYDYSMASLLESSPDDWNANARGVDINHNFDAGWAQLRQLALQVPFILLFSLFIATVLNQKFRGRTVMRAVFFLPVIIATGPVMSRLTSQGVSSVPMVSQNALLGVLSGLPEFIYEPINNLFSSLIMILWNSGIQILIFLSGLQKVPGTLYEAAKIDGASAWETFWKITLPTMKPLILLNSIYTVVTLATGGSNEIIELIYTATYTATQGYSYAMAMSWIYTLVVAVILVIVYLLLKEKSDRHVVYETKRPDMKGVQNAGRR